MNLTVIDKIDLLISDTMEDIEQYLSNKSIPLEYIKNDVYLKLSSLRDKIRKELFREKRHIDERLERLKETLKQIDSMI